MSGAERPAAGIHDLLPDFLSGIPLYHIAVYGGLCWLGKISPQGSGVENRIHGMGINPETGFGSGIRFVIRLPGGITELFTAGGMGTGKGSDGMDENISIRAGRF
jgi:hypothetical protein